MSAPSHILVAKGEASLGDTPFPQTIDPKVIKENQSEDILHSPESTGYQLYKEKSSQKTRSHGETAWLIAKLVLWTIASISKIFSINYPWNHVVDIWNDLTDKEGDKKKSVIVVQPNQAKDTQSIDNINKQTLKTVQSTQDIDNQLNIDKPQRLVEKADLIDDQFNQESQGTSFATHLCSLRLLTTALPLDNQKVLSHPLLTKLNAYANQEQITNPLTAAKELYTFQKDILKPALCKVSTQEALSTFQPILEICSKVKTQVQEVDKKGALDQVEATISELYHYKQLATSMLYQFTQSYKPGNCGELKEPSERQKIVKRLSKLQKRVEKVAHEAHMPIEDKVRMYEAILQIQKEFGEYKAELDPVMQAFERTFQLPEGIQSAFPMQLKQLVSEPLCTPLDPLMLKLKVFAKNHVIPAIEKTSTEEELSVLEPIIDLLKEVEEKVHNQDENAQVFAKGLNPTDFYTAKLHKTNKLFSFLVGYQKGDAGDLTSPSRRKKVGTEVRSFIKKIIPSLNHSVYSDEEKQALYQAVSHLQQDLAEQGEENQLLDTPLKSLRKTLDITKPKAVKNKELLTTQTARASQEITKQDSQIEEKRARSLQTIQGKISRLDLRSWNFKEDLVTIKDEIKKIRSLPGTSPHTLSDLEKALETLQDPKLLKISYEESLFMQLLGEKYNIDDRELSDYITSEQATIKEAQSALLKALKKDARDLNTLNKTAKKAVKQAIASAKQNRFLRFTHQHSFSPALNHHFSSHYPELIITYEQFSHDAITKPLEAFWVKMEKMFDDESEGQFSSILKTYSYLDPRKEFETYKKECLSAFFRELDLSAIDQMTSQQLEKLLKKEIKKKKDAAVALFEADYHNYSQSHLWLLDNLPHIQEAYNQGDEDNTNLGEGVCYNNCLDRISQFAKNPKLDRKTIKMGSNHKTRYHQLRLDKHFLAVNNGSMATQQAIQAENENCTVYGLALHYTHDIESKGQVRNRLVTDIQTYSDMGYKQALLALRTPEKPGGHAINLHFDKENRVYGFEDDNLGRVEFENLTIMQEQLELYLTHFYPDHTRLALEFYRVQ